MRRRRAPFTDAYRRFIALGSILQVDDADFPFPLVERAERVKKLLLAMYSEVAQLLGSGLALEAVELLALDLECVADAAILTEHGVKNVIEIAEVQRVRHSYQADNHRVDVAENCSQN